MIDRKYLLIDCHVAAVAIDETMLQVHYGTKTENFKRYSACTAQDTLSALCTVSSCWVAAIVMALSLSLQCGLRPQGQACECSLGGADAMSTHCRFRTGVACLELLQRTELGCRKLNWGCVPSAVYNSIHNLHVKSTCKYFF